VYKTIFLNKKIMNKYFSFIIVMLVYCLNANAQDNAVYHKKWMVQNGDTLPYRVLMPLNYDSTKEYPVIFFLHGAGERGRENERQLIHGSKLFAKEEIRTQYPAIVIMPQCPTDDYWANVLRVHDDAGNRLFFFLEDGVPGRYMELLQELVRHILKVYPAKMNQVYVGGLSMGGMGTFELVRRMPNTFAAAFPICGGANPATAKKMKKVNWWIFHGAKDNVVPPQHSEEMVTALKAAKAKVKWTLFPEANHNAWDPAFAEPDLLPWLFKNIKK
jgi:predicted peptidase